ncbi:MAG: MBL fold metallo-hydrolase [Clostridia bacterium]|nr:MBL fold metallo-hydrolase [Clostridia bacterium]
MLRTISCGLLSSNVYVVWNEASLDCMIVDCGADVKYPLSVVEELGLNVKYVVLTHGHFDHVDFLEDYVSTFKNAIFACHVAEKAVLEDVEANLSFWGSHPRKYEADFLYLNEGDTLSLGKEGEECMIFKVIHTPGHTPGSMCLLCERDKIMLTGDTIFQNSYGRTDFKHGSSAQLVDSLKRILSMDWDITLYSGHYGSTTIGDEVAFYS